VIKHEHACVRVVWSMFSGAVLPECKECCNKRRVRPVEQWSWVSVML
jgi:hypothetical protein